MKEKETRNDRLIYKMLSFLFMIVLLWMLMPANRVSAEYSCDEHNWSGWETEYASTCTMNGCKIRVCIDCGEVDEQMLPLAAHEYGPWYVISEATCTEEGVGAVNCTMCGCMLYDPIPMKEHTYDGWYTIEAATCIHEGLEAAVCTACGDEVTYTIPVKSHTFGEWKVIRKSTCSEKGLREHTCNICGKTQSEEIEKASHTWGKPETLEPTDILAGYKKYVCEVCKEEKLDHIFPEGMLRKGDRGDEVKKLQEALNREGYNCGTPDGIFGQQTENAVIAYARANDLPDDGCVWPRIISMLLGNGKSACRLQKSVENQQGNGACFVKGDKIIYKITLINDSKETVSDIEIADPLKGSNEDSVVTLGESLKPGKSKSWTFQYTVTEKDVKRGHIDNTAVATYMIKNMQQKVTSNKVRVFTAVAAESEEETEKEEKKDKKEKKETNSCIQTLEKRSNIDSLYTIHYCAEHEKTLKVVNEMVGAASSAEERLTAWLSARGLWQNETEKMYEELLKERSDKAAELIQEEKRLFEEQLAKHRELLGKIYLQEPDEVERIITALYQRHCFELCYELHNASEEREDDLSQVTPEKHKTEEAAEVCASLYTEKDSANGECTEYFCYEHYKTLGAMDTLLKNDNSKDTWESIETLWTADLNQIYDRLKARVGKENEELLSEDREAFYEWIEAYREMQQLLYPKNEEIAAQVTGKEIINRVLELCIWTK